MAFLCVTPHTPPTHTHYDDDGTQRPARAGVADAHLEGAAPAGAGAVRPRLRRLGGGPRPAVRRARRNAGPAPPTASRPARRPPRRAGGPAIETLSAHQGRHFSSSDRFAEAERNGTPFPASPRGRILLAIGDAAETTDTLYPWMRLMEAGYECVVGAPEVRTYQLVLHERPEGWHITRESPGYQFEADIAFKDVKPEEYDGILISGGRAPEYIRYDQALNDVVRWMLAHGRPVGSVCHGIEVLATADVIRGKRVTCVPKCQFDAEVVGATYVAAPVVVDGLLVTARGARDGWLWMREYLRLLEQIERAPAGNGAASPVATAGAV